MVGDSSARPMFRSTPRLALTVGCSGLLVILPARADWRDDVGATRLNVTFANVPTAVGTVTQAEAGDTAGNSYLPDSTNPAFAGKTIVNKSAGSGTSGHATAVGGFFYGTSSLLPTTTTIHAYNASTWAGSDSLRLGNTASAPMIESNRVQNHSWIGDHPDTTEATVLEIGRRLDFAVERDGFVCVAGVNNGLGTTLPKLLAQAYNLLSVGRTDGAHSAGFTTYDGTGRIKPDLVAPADVTSFSTPQVASAAGVLAARALASPHALSGANVARVVKALLLAGATKEEFPAWARTPTRPLDLRHGAGEMNLLLAYRTLESGRATPSAGTLVAESGWAATSLANGAQHTYFFEVPAGAASAPFSVVLTWHRLVNDGTQGPLGWSPSPVALVNLDLTLRQASGFTVGAQLDASASTVDNVEHIYTPALAPGRYALVVTSPVGAATTNYALAWRTTPTVTVAASVAEARESDGAPGEFTVARSGSTATPLLVPITVGGSAVSGIHYAALPASVLIPAGAASVKLPVAPIADSLAQGGRTVTLTLVGDYSLAAGASAGATVSVVDKPYDAWRFMAFDQAQLTNATISGASADPDADGMPNLLEYALGGAPLDVADGREIAPALGLGGDTGTGEQWLTLSYVQPAGRADLNYLVEWSDDLTSSWQNGASVTTEVGRVSVEEGGERVTVRAAAPLAEQGRQFLRLRVTHP